MRTTKDVSITLANSHAIDTQSLIFDIILLKAFRGIDLFHDQNQFELSDEIPCAARNLSITI